MSKLDLMKSGWWRYYEIGFEIAALFPHARSEGGVARGIGLAQAHSTIVKGLVFEKSHVGMVANGGTLAISLESGHTMPVVFVVAFPQSDIPVVAGCGQNCGCEIPTDAPNGGFVVVETSRQFHLEHYRIDWDWTSLPVHMFIHEASSTSRSTHWPRWQIFFLCCTIKRVYFDEWRWWVRESILCEWVRVWLVIQQKVGDRDLKRGV